MIEYRTGDILAADTEALVNTVNCVGVMGRGIALQFKNAFPANCHAYERACLRGDVRPGRMFVFDTHAPSTPRYIVNFPTKRHWRGKSRMEDIEAGLTALADDIRALGLRSIAIPPLGSGLGGLNWAEVRRRIEDALAGLNEVRIVVYEPGGSATRAAVTAARTVPKMTSGRAALVVLVDRYRRGLLDPFVSLLEIHKLMYFMQEAGQVLRLRYVAAPYGPYADNLRHVLREIEGHLVVGFDDGGDAPGMQLEIVDGAFEEASTFLRGDEETRHHFDRVADLVEGFESPFGLELLSTVHWVITRGDLSSIEAATAATYAWNRRKRQFTPDQIRLAAGVLAEKGWIARSFARSNPTSG
ncbi:MAG: macro domain-containing protein [Alphaproteobacteria bacterium]|nr:macro domain-containing protein [Alphaproteobacteria bacterium]